MQLYCTERCGITIALRAERRGYAASEHFFDPRGRQHDGIMLDILERRKPLWTGIFAFGEGRYDGAGLFGPQGNLLVVSHGQAYVVDVRDARTWRAIDAYNIKGMLIDPMIPCGVLFNDRRLVVVWDVDRQGYRDLHSDGISGVAIHSGTIMGDAEIISLGSGVQRFSIPLEESQFTPV